MLNYDDFELSFCLGSLDGRCLRRAAQLGLAVQTAVASPGKSAKVAGLVGPGPDLSLPSGPRSALPARASKALVQVSCPQSRRRSGATVQEALQADEALGNLGSPRLALFHQHSVWQPIAGWSDGVRDIVYDLNNQQPSRLQVHFWCDGDDVRWQIVGRLPPQQMANPMPEHLADRPIKAFTQSVYQDRLQLRLKPSTAGLSRRTLVHCEAVIQCPIVCS